MSHLDVVDAQEDNAGSGDDNIDARFSRITLGGSSAYGSGATVSAGGEGGDTKYRYRMDYPERGRLIIINNKTFHPDTRMNARSGTDKDAASLYTDFRQLGFEVQLVHNQTASQMLQLMTKASQEDHSNRDCFAVAVLTHGDDGVLFGTDATIAIDNFIQPIKMCRTLIGKPKIFIFQACRGNELDDGQEVDDAISDDPPPAQRIPIEADFVYAYSTTPGYFSWRNSAKGSWFIQAMHRMIEKYGNQLDFVSLLTRVNYEVAYEFESNAAQAHMTRKKQIPSIVSMLTKDLYFNPKQK